eukprot:6114478-Pyramimonas_sp.AAC.2
MCIRDRFCCRGFRYEKVLLVHRSLCASIVQLLVWRAPEMLVTPYGRFVEPADGAAGCLVVRLVVGRSQR